jgi:hypothetical protein
MSALSLLPLTNLSRVRIKVMVKRILNKHGYPPDLQEEAVKTVLAQQTAVIRLCRIGFLHTSPASPIEIAPVCSKG